MKVLDENLKVGDDGMVETVSPSPVLDLAGASRRASLPLPSTVC